MSRGIEEAEARKLVVRGFFAELINKIPVAELRERLGDVIEARLAEGHP
jgi:Fe-S cluster assembly protein SufD